MKISVKQKPINEPAKPRKKSRASSISPQASPQLAGQNADSSEDHPQVLRLTLKDFVTAAWGILEPVSPLVWNWHLDLICEYLTLIKDNAFKSGSRQDMEGIIFNVPPRTMKSLLISVFFPVWVWTSDPSRRFMFVSYSEKLSTQHSVYRRTVIESDWYQRSWGSVFSLSRDQNVKSHYENSCRGTMFSTGMQATATGMGGDILVFDDPLNPEQAVSQAEREAVNLRFDTTFRSRINDPVTGIKIIIMQRLHELDLTGHVLARESDRWKHLSLPAIAEKNELLEFPISGRCQHRSLGEALWPARLSESFLAGQRIGMGSWAFSGQYQQSPAPLDGGIIKRQWVRFYRQLPELFEFMVQSWDCTFSGGSDNDFVAGQVWARSGGKYYMLPYRTYDRLDFGPTMAAIKACHGKFPRAHAILIEDKANGPAIISELQKEIAGIVAVNPEGGKIARAQATAPLWESGSIELPDPQVFGANWVEDYIQNLCAFPKAAHDDDMDATSQALIYMRSRLGGGIVDFYRQQATGEITQPLLRGGAARRSPASPNRMTETALARSIIEAVARGSQIQCNIKQYPGIRAALHRVIESSVDAHEHDRSVLVSDEIRRLDELHGWISTVE
jgi:predicted phage terminase large subunit-like protein